MPERMLRVALGQVRVGDHVSEDVEKIASFLRRGRELGVAVVLFPEGAVGGYFGVNFHDPADLDGDAVEQGLLRIQQVARETGVAAAVGASRRAPDGRLTNSLLLISGQGEVHAEYVKTQLTASDRKCYTPGSSLPVVNFEGVPLGLQICYDQRFPEPWRVLALRGAQVVLHCSNACVPGDTWKIPVIEAHLRSRAAENGFFVVSVNHGGPSQNWGSVIYDPHGLDVARAGYDCEELVPADLDLTRVSTTFIQERRTDLAAVYSASDL